MPKLTSDQVGTDELLRELQKRSVTASTDGGTFPISIVQIARAADEAPRWWSSYRDQYLRKFFSQEPYLCGAIYSVICRDAAYKLEFHGPELGVERAKKLLATANLFKGWYNFGLKVSLDLRSQDNGGFFEIIRPARVKVLGGLKGRYERYNGATLEAARRAVKSESGETVPSWYVRTPHPYGWVSLEGAHYEVKDSPFDLPVGLNHLDAARCERVGDPEKPIIYTDMKGVQHELKWYQVVTLEDMPSSQEEMHDVGVCAVSRALRLAQTLRDMQIYKQEKVSGRFAGSIYLTNVLAKFITDAVATAGEDALNQNLSRYMPPIVASTLEPEATPAVAEIKLASLPDGFNEEETLRWYIAGLALALGVDYSYLAPLPGNKLGTSQQAEVMERQSRGKASRLFMAQMEQIFNFRGILPKNVWAEYREVDVEEELARDTARQRRAKTRSIMIESGEITAAMARQMAVDEGDYDKEYLKMVEEEDVTPETGNGDSDGRWTNLGDGRNRDDDTTTVEEDNETEKGFRRLLSRKKKG